MKNRYWSSSVLTLVMVCACALLVVRAQQPGAPAKKQPPQDKNAPPVSQDQQEGSVITTIVRLPVTVMDKDTNRFITSLNAEDFEILEDKVRQKIESFRPISELPLDVAVLMDTSNSVRPKLKFEKSAATSFIETVLKSRNDRALFVSFDSEIELHQDFTNKLDLLSKAIDKVKAHGATRLYDAVYRVCEEKMSASPGRRRAMVVITDGEDTESERNLKDAIDFAQRSETTVFVISTKAGGFFGVEAGTIDTKEDKDLKRLAEETGGRAFFTGNVLELERSFSAIATELRSQYLISYAPANENFDGKFRKIEVRLPGHKNLRIRARDGYTAVPRNVRAGLKMPGGQ
ncbi:MAG: VWA domain-containing protein [Blastocatellia bacterium]